MEHNRGAWLISVAILVALLIGLQVWASIESTRQVETVMSELAQLSSNAIGNETAREELIKARIENQRETLFWHSLINFMAPMITAFVAVVGIVSSWRAHLETRNKERLDRAATELAIAFERLASKVPMERALGIASLQHFLEPDKYSFHLRALSALATVARTESDDDVLRAVRIALNQAVKTVSHENLSSIVWQGVKLRGVIFSGLDFSGADISSAQLHDARLDNAILVGCNLAQTSLNGASLEAANLSNVNFTGTDLSGASLRNANLKGAILADVWVHNLDIEGAQLQGAQLDIDEIPWDQIRNWRKAKFDKSIEDRLVTRFGPLSHGARILMLMWEIPPYVEGGSWTACFHLVRNLRQAGSDITVVVPWENSNENLSPFGVEVNLIYLGIRPPREIEPAAVHRIYGSSLQNSIYGSFSPYSYSTSGPYSKGYGVYSSDHRNRFAQDSRNFFGTYTLYEASEVDNIFPIFGIVQEFARRVVKRLENESFDLVHAQDWVTFRAAEELSSRTRKPWFAHFHSTEADRQPSAPHPGIQALESHAAKVADKLIAVSNLTSRRIQETYKINSEKITTVHNPLSLEVIEPLNWGTPETRRVVYLGRFAEQKGTDRFVELAQLLKQHVPAASFVMYGSGQCSPLLQDAAQNGTIKLMGCIEWQRRYEAFRGASLVVVPSRFEPFGMVILEAMLHRVPVIYPKSAGAAEVIQAGFPVDPDDISAMADIGSRLLLNWPKWKQVVDEQTSALESYLDTAPESALTELWESLSADIGSR